MKKSKKISLWAFTSVLTLVFVFLGFQEASARYGDNGVIKGKVRAAGEYKRFGSFKPGRRVIFLNGEWRKNKRLKRAKVYLLSGGKSSVVDTDRTDRRGRYEFSGLDRDKSYYVKAKKSGYDSQSKGKIKLRGGDHRRIAFVNFYLYKD